MLLPHLIRNAIAGGAHEDLASQALPRRPRDESCERRRAMRRVHHQGHVGEVIYSGRIYVQSRSRASEVSSSPT